MKFSDPLSSMQYMGGTLSIHTAMTIYCLQQYEVNRGFFNDCRSNLSSKLGYDDILIMLAANLCGVLYVCI